MNEAILNKHMLHVCRSSKKKHGGQVSNPSIPYLILSLTFNEVSEPANRGKIKDLTIKTLFIPR